MLDPVKVSRRAAYLAAVSAGLVLCGCGDRGPSQSETVRREFAFGDTLLIIGQQDGRDGHALHRVSSAHRSSNGDLYIADGGSNEVRVFDATGDMIRSFSGRGGGPGEHQVLAWLRPAASDTIVTYDGLARKLSYWSPDGTLGREYRLPAGMSSLIGRVNDDLYVEVTFERARAFPLGTSHTDTIVIDLLSMSDRKRRHLTKAPYQTRFAATLPNGSTIYTPLPLEPQTVYAAGGSSVYVGYPAEWRIRRFNAAGEELEPVVIAQARRPLTAAAREAWKAPIVEGMPVEERPDMVRYLAALPYSDSMPAYDTLIVDEDDRLWVREFPVPGADSAVWRIMDNGGAILGRAVLRPQQRLFQVGRDFAVVGEIRPDGAEVVTIRRLR